MLLRNPYRIREIQMFYVQQAESNIFLVSVFKLNTLFKEDVLILCFCVLMHMYINAITVNFCKLLGAIVNILYIMQYE